jgi:hypothetical protein
VRIEAGGDGGVAHAGLHGLGSFRRPAGFGDMLSARIPPAGERLPVHDRGKVQAFHGGVEEPGVTGDGLGEEPASRPQDTSGFGQNGESLRSADRVVERSGLWTEPPRHAPQPIRVPPPQRRRTIPNHHPATSKGSTR